MRNGKGKEYDKSGKLEYEGEYLNDKRNGKGKEIKDTYNSHSEFEGEFINGKRWNGIGKKHKFDHICINFMEYELKNGKLWNLKEYDKNNNIINELIDGNGFIKKFNRFGKIKYEGEYLNGIKNGKWKEYDCGKLEYEGEYLNGEKNGKGK